MIPLAVFSNRQGMIAWISAAPASKQEPGKLKRKSHMLEKCLIYFRWVVEKNAGDHVGLL